MPQLGKQEAHFSLDCKLDLHTVRSGKHFIKVAALQCKVRKWQNDGSIQNFGSVLLCLYYGTLQFLDCMLFFSALPWHIVDLGWADHRNYAWQLAGKLSATGEIYNELSITSKYEMPAVHLAMVRLTIGVYAQYSKMAFVCQKSSKAKRENLHQISDQCAYQTVDSPISKLVWSPLADDSCGDRTYVSVSRKSWQWYIGF